MGYDGFADKSGKGYIHSSEPTQAIFLNPAAYNVITILRNDEALHKDNEDKNIRLNKIEKQIQRGLLSPKAWFQLLSGFEAIEVFDFWDQCPYEEIKNDPTVLAHINNSKLNQVGYKYYLNRLIVRPFEYDILPSIFKRNTEFIQTLKKQWVTSTNSHFLNNLPDIVKHDPGFMQAMKERWLKEVKRDPYVYNDLPDIFKNDSEIITVAKKSLVKNYFNSSLRLF